MESLARSAHPTLPFFHPSGQRLPSPSLPPFFSSSPTSSFPPLPIAWKASAYLNSLLTDSQITLEPSASLDAVYARSPSAPNTLLLTLDKVPAIVKAFGLEEEEALELRRAVGQAKDRLAQGATVEEAEEKEKGE